MTTKGEWTAYTGSDEQIDKIMNSAHGYLYRNNKGYESNILIATGSWANLANELNNDDVTHYLIIPDDPLRDMKIRQAQTGQLVYVKTPSKRAKGKFSYYKTTNPNWSEIGAEYSFTAFEPEHFHKEAGPEDKEIYQSIADNYYKSLTKSKDTSK